MKLATTLLVLFALQIDQVEGQFLRCRIFGFIGKLFSGTLERYLDNNVAGEETDTGLALPYNAFRIDNFDRPSFDGCTVTIAGDMTFVGTTPFPDESGTFEVEGTLELALPICVYNLTVTMLDFETPPGQTAEDWARAYINDQFENPECFESEHQLWSQIINETQ